MIILCQVEVISRKRLDISTFLDILLVEIQFLLSKNKFRQSWSKYLTAIADNLYFLKKPAVSLIYDQDCSLK